MKVNINEPNPGAWFDIPNDPDGARIKLRVCPPSVARDIQSKTKGPRQVEYKEHKRFEFYNEPDRILEDKLYWGYCVADWEGITDEDGKPVECNEENVARLATQSIEIAMFITQALDKLNTDQVEYAKELEKNFKTS